MPDEPACRFTCPVSPSTNNLYRGKRWKTDDYKSWQNLAGWSVKRQHPAPVSGRVRVVIEAPFNRTRDIDNIKPILDLAQSLGIIENDNRVDELVIRRVRLDQSLTVSIWPLTAPPEAGAE